MIRRTLRDNAGAESWVLISQVEHARLAGLLAEQWGRAPFALLQPRDELVAAIHHHDDGWADWERAAGVDAESGRPLDFTEMPLVESLAIWRDSIASAGRNGKLAAHAVSAHFCALLRRFSARWRTLADQTAIAKAFLADQEQQQSVWLRELPAGAGVAAAATALRCLQAFDALSLWLCCSRQPSPETFELPDVPPVSFRSDAEFVVTASPWPFRADRFDLEVVGRSIPAIRYESPAALATAPAQAAKLRWSFLPAG
jgi:hypothetical protein